MQFRRSGADPGGKTEAAIFPLLSPSLVQLKRKGASVQDVVNLAAMTAVRAQAS